MNRPVNINDMIELLYSRVIVLQGAVSDSDVVVSVPVGPDPEEPGLVVHDGGLESALEKDVLRLQNIHCLAAAARLVLIPAEAQAWKYTVFMYHFSFANGTFKVRYIVTRFFCIKPCVPLLDYYRHLISFPEILPYI